LRDAVAARLRADLGSDEARCLPAHLMPHHAEPSGGPVHQIISMIKWIRTSRLSIKNLGPDEPWYLPTY